MRIAESKADQRSSLRKARQAYVASLTPAMRATLQAALVQRLCAELPQGQRIALYLAVGDEVDACSLADHAPALGWQLGLPRVTGEGLMDFHLWDPQQPLEKGLAGIPQPKADAPLLVPDVILLPLVGADATGQRLGQGAGYYDRALARLHAAGQHPRCIGLAWDVQIMTSIAHEPHDMPLDALCTPTRWIACRTSYGDAGRQIG